MRIPVLAAVLAGALLFAACGGGSSEGSTPASAARLVTTIPSAQVTQSVQSATSVGAGQAAALRLSSPACTDGRTIPVAYSCDGKSASPEVDWSGAPAATKAVALVLHDADAPMAGGFTHWVVHNIPATATKLPAGASPAGALPPGTLEGQTSSGNDGYTGPCPPKGANAAPLPVHPVRA